VRQFFKVTNTSSQQLCYETDLKKTKTSIHQLMFCVQGKHRETLQQVIKISFVLTEVVECYFVKKCM
jgi:hypothetical protein